MTVIQPNSVSGINSITVQNGNSLSVHKSDGSLIRTITGTTGLTTFRTISVGSATTDFAQGSGINIGLGASISNGSGNVLTFGTGGDDRVHITSAGKVGVNETSPDEQLHITNGSGNNFYKVEASNIAGLKLVGGAGVNHIICDDSLAFFTNSNPSAGSGGASSVERLRIDSSGRVLIGVATQSISSSQMFEVSGMSYFSNNSAGTGTIYIRNAHSDTAAAPHIVFTDGGGNRAGLSLDNAEMMVLTGQNGYKFLTGGTVGGGTEKVRITSDGKILHGASLVSQSYGGGFVISPGTTKTVTISGLISGSFMFQAGTYGAAGANQGGISFVANGYMTASWTYHVEEIKKWSNGGATGMSISAVTQNASNCTFTMQNSHGSYTAGCSWHLWGNDEITVSVS